MLDSDQSFIDGLRQAAPPTGVDFVERFRPLILKVLLVCFSFVVFALFAEAVVRVTVDGPVVPRFVMDSGFGIRMPIPNASYRHYFPGDYDIAIRTNNVGSRGTRDYAVEKAPGTKRIAVIGDSFIFGYGVEDDETVAEKLQEALGDDVEVLNFSVSGFGQAEQLVMVDHLVKTFDIDTAVLFFFDNDIENNINSGLFTLDDQGKLERTGTDYLPGVKMREWLHAFWVTDFLFRHSRLWNLVRERVAGMFHRSNRQRNQDSGRVKRAKALTTMLLGDLAGRFPKSVVYVIPACHPKTRVIGSRFGELSEGIPEEMTVIGGIQAHSSDHYYQTDTHWNPQGHHRAAEVLAAWFKTQRDPGQDTNRPELLDKQKPMTP